MPLDPEITIYYDINLHGQPFTEMYHNRPRHGYLYEGKRYYLREYSSSKDDEPSSELYVF